MEDDTLCHCTPYIFRFTINEPDQHRNFNQRGTDCKLPVHIKHDRQIGYRSQQTNMPRIAVQNHIDIECEHFIESLYTLHIDSDQNGNSMEIQQKME